MLYNRIVFRCLSLVRRTGSCQSWSGRSNLMKHSAFEQISSFRPLLSSCVNIQQWTSDLQVCHYSTRRKSQSATSERKCSSQPSSSSKKNNGNGNKTGDSTIPNVDNKTDDVADEKASVEAESTENLSIFQRFKKTYKEHGKVLVAVHVATSIVWFGTFFYTVKSGVDVVGILERWGTSETILKPFKSSSVGEAAIAYLMYKLATPARYTVTLTGTNMAIRYLRKTGKMAQVPKNDSFRNLYKDSKIELKSRSQVIKHRRTNRKKKKKDVDHKK